MLPQVQGVPIERPTLTVHFDKPAPGKLTVRYSLPDDDKQMQVGPLDWESIWSKTTLAGKTGLPAVRSQRSGISSQRLDSISEAQPQTESCRACFVHRCEFPVRAALCFSCPFSTPYPSLFGCLQNRIHPVLGQSGLLEPIQNHLRRFNVRQTAYAGLKKEVIMRSVFTSLSFIGGLCFGCASVFADGAAETAPPRPAPTAAVYPDRTPNQTPLRLVNVRLPPAPTATGGTSVRPLLPADYRPRANVPSGKETTAKPQNAAPTKNSSAAKRIPLAPTEADLRREVALRDGGPSVPPPDRRSVGERLSDQATRIPAQRREWPTTVTNTAGPTSPAGAGSAQDRKGTVIEATGPTHGVIRNRF